MEFEVLSENLAEALSAVLRAVSSRPQLPVLANVLLETRKDGLYVAGTDLEQGVLVKVGAKVEEEGKVTVPAKMFSEFISSLPAGRVNLKMEKESLQAEAGAYSAEFQTISAEEFPELPSFEDVEGEGLEFDTGEFEEKMGRVLYSASQDSMRPVLTGVLFEFEGESLKLVATDGFRLSLQEMGEVKGEVPEESVVLPARALGEVMRVKTGEKIEMKILEETNQAVFVRDGVLFVTQVLDGEFPDYGKIIPDKQETSVKVAREELEEAVDVAQVFAKDNSNVVRWEIKEGMIVMSSESPEQGKNTSEVEVEMEGEGGEIAFNGRFLLDFLRNSEVEMVEFEMSDSLSPGSFQEEGNEEFLYVVMPINL